jgi:hypothetical protein
MASSPVDSPPTIGSKLSATPVPLSQSNAAADACQQRGPCQNASATPGKAPRPHAQLRAAQLVQFALVGIQNRISGPYLAATNRILLGLALHPAPHWAHRNTMRPVCPNWYPE